MDNNPFSNSASGHFDSFREDERALELARRDPTMKKRFVRRFGLPAADHELVFFHCHAQFAAVEAGNGERDPEPVGARFLDVVGRIGVAGAFRGPLEQPFQMLEAQKKRAVEIGIPRSSAKALLERLCRIFRVSGLRPIQAPRLQECGDFGGGSSVPLLFTNPCVLTGTLRQPWRLRRTGGEVLPGSPGRIHPPHFDQPARLDSRSERRFSASPGERVLQTKAFPTSS